MSIDLAQARTFAEGGSELDELRVSRRWLRQALSEIEQGRWAMARLQARGGDDAQLLDLSGTPQASGTIS